MSKDYKKVIIAIIVLILLVGAGFFINYLRNRPSQELQELLVLPQGVVLTEEQQMKYDAARTALEENVNNPQALVALAQLKYDFRDLDGAISVYLKALEIQPANTLILNNLADIYIQKKDYQKAADMYLRIIDYTPKWVNAYRNLATIYKYQLKDRYSGMEQILLDGIKIIEELEGGAPVDLYSMLAVFYDETGEIDKAIEYYEIVVKLTPENVSAKMRLEELKQL
jgi:tetratricopeptide (TPR) repeat protein